MRIDYREHKQVNKNRPKNRPVKLVILFGAGIVVGIYSLGVATGWFLNKAKKISPAGATAAADAKPKTTDTSLPASVQPQQRGTNKKTNDPPLTFYYTLPKGEKTALGSGLNPVRRDVPSAARSNPTAGQRPSSSGTSSTGTESGESVRKKNVTGKETPDEAIAQNKTETTNKRYTVQVASYSAKKEAESLKNVLDRQGLLSYVVESKVSGKGTWYRVRLGNQLDLETANKIAAKAGKGAIVVSE